MHVEEYEAMPDIIEPEQVEALVDTFLREGQSDKEDETKRKLAVLCDRQWHTYRAPSERVRGLLREWILSHWEDKLSFYELVMGIAYSFALDKELFERALKSYHGVQRWEYLRMLENSPGDFLDPYWSLHSR